MYGSWFLITIFVSNTHKIFMTMNALIKLVEEANSERRKIFPHFQAGDTISVYTKITEGNKERIQQFQGTVIQRRNVSTNGETFTVRKISEGIGVERIFPLLSPSIEKIMVQHRGAVRRARLYYLRGKQGKAARVKERRS